MIDGESFAITDEFPGACAGEKLDLSLFRCSSRSDRPGEFVPHLAPVENASITTGSKPRFATFWHTGTIQQSILVVRAKTARFPFPIPGGSISGKRETEPWGAPIREGPGESVTNPAGHVSVMATPSEIRAAIVQQSPANPLSDFGLKLLEDGSSYRIPKK